MPPFKSLRAVLVALLLSLLLNGCLTDDELKAALVGPEGVARGCGEWRHFDAIHIGDSAPACANDPSNGYYYALQSTVDTGIGEIKIYHFYDFPNEIFVYTLNGHVTQKMKSPSVHSII